LVRRRVVNRLKARLVGYERRLVRRKEDCTVLMYDRTLLEKLMATCSSYLAHLKMANTYRLKKLLSRFEWLRYFFERHDGKLKRIYQVSKPIQSFKAQYQFIIRKYPGSLLFFQVGRFYEFYDKQAEIAQRLLRLKGTGARRGFRTRCGFPVNLQERYLRRLVKRGFSVHVVREEDHWLYGIKKRSIGERWIPTSIAAD